MNSEYRIEGSGKSAAEAEKQLEGPLERVVNKLKDAKKNTDVKIKRTIFRIEYALSNPEPGEKINVRVESPVSWSHAIDKAQKRIQVGAYNSTYTIERYLDLTAEQHRAVEGKPTAGPSERGAGSSYLESLGLPKY